MGRTSKEAMVSPRNFISIYALLIDVVLLACPWVWSAGWNACSHLLFVLAMTCQHSVSFSTFYCLPYVYYISIWSMVDWWWSNVFLLAVSRSGHSGSLGFFWNSNTRVELLPYSQYHIDTIITESGCEPWRLACVYGEAHVAEHHKTWEMLKFIEASTWEEEAINHSCCCWREGGGRGSKAVLQCRQFRWSSSQTS
jgi:hypothetical protein